MHGDSNDPHNGGQNGDPHDSDQEHKGQGNGGGHDSMAERGHGRMSHAMHGEMSLDDRWKMLREHHAKTLWVHFLNIALGVWLMTAPFTFGYESAALTWSDVASGALAVVFGVLSLFPRNVWAPWGVCFVGIWLEAAPLLFWAPTPAAYLNDTFVGAWLIGLSILVPGMPGMILRMQHGPEIPPGWTYTPSSWMQRAPLIALGFAGWLVSRYLAAVQLGYIPEAWEPFFAEGTRRVLHSDMSKAWPVSDAGLGAFSYTFEALMGFMGGAARWRTMPWMVLFFGILVVPLGLVHIVLVISQPVTVGYWCTLCLLAAFIMLLMIPLMLDEVVAMVQFMQASVRNGEPFWGAFWKGGTMKGGGKDDRTPEFYDRPSRWLPSMVWGVTLPWTLLASAALGAWLMAAPSVFGSGGWAASSDHLAGALIVTVAGIATAEVARAGRFLNVVLGAWVMIAPWVLSGAAGGARWNDLAAGLAVIALSLPRGPVRERYGGWDRYIV